MMVGDEDVDVPVATHEITANDVGEATVADNQGTANKPAVVERISGYINRFILEFPPFLDERCRLEHVRVTFLRTIVMPVKLCCP